MDRFGRVNMGCFITLLSGLSCLCIWMFATSYEILILFGLVNVRRFFKLFSNETVLTRILKGPP